MTAEAQPRLCGFWTHAQGNRREDPPEDAQKGNSLRARWKRLRSETHGTDIVRVLRVVERTKEVGCGSGISREVDDGSISWCVCFGVDGCVV